MPHLTLSSRDILADADPSGLPDSRKVTVSKCFLSTASEHLCLFCSLAFISQKQPWTTCERWAWAWPGLAVFRPIYKPGCGRGGAGLALVC